MVYGLGAIIIEKKSAIKGGNRTEARAGIRKRAKSRPARVPSVTFARYWKEKEGKDNVSGDQPYWHTTPYGGVFNVKFDSFSFSLLVPIFLSNGKAHYDNE